MAQEWLLVRRTSQGKCSYTLSNAPSVTTSERLARLRCQRSWIERANQDAKSEAGWDELQAQKYGPWEHHLALTILATWFVVETNLDRARDHHAIRPGSPTSSSTTCPTCRSPTSGRYCAQRSRSPTPPQTAPRLWPSTTLSTARAHAVADANASSTLGTTPDLNVALPS